MNIIPFSSGFGTKMRFWIEQTLRWCLRERHLLTAQSGGRGGGGKRVNMIGFGSGFGAKMRFRIAQTLGRREGKGKLLPEEEEEEEKEEEEEEKLLQGVSRNYGTGNRKPSCKLPRRLFFLGHQGL